MKRLRRPLAAFVIRAPAKHTQYQAELRGPAWPLGGGPMARFDTIAACGRWCRAMGAGNAGGDTCDVTLANGWIVARWVRDPHAAGRWARVRD